MTLSPSLSCLVTINDLVMYLCDLHTGLFLKFAFVSNFKMTLRSLCGKKSGFDNVQTPQGGCRYV